MVTRHEITKKYAREYQCASKKDKGRVLDEAVAVTGWSRANARPAIVAAANREGPARAVRRKPRARTYGYDTLKVLIEVWTLIGEPRAGSTWHRSWPRRWPSWRSSVSWAKSLTGSTLRCVSNWCP